MIARRLVVVAAAVLAFGVPARADREPLGAHTGHPTKTVVLDNDRVQPSTLDMSQSDALVFENHSVHPITVTFTEPEHIAEKIRCGLVRKTAKEKPEAPWQLFTWTTDGKLTATIPPGRFASVCSLQEGSYAFLTSRLSTGVGSQGRSGALPEKGRITVH